MSGAGRTVLAISSQRLSPVPRPKSNKCIKRLNLSDPSPKRQRRSRWGGQTEHLDRHCLACGRSGGPAACPRDTSSREPLRPRPRPAHPSGPAHASGPAQAPVGARSHPLPSRGGAQGSASGWCRRAVFAMELVPRTSPVVLLLLLLLGLSTGRFGKKVHQRPVHPSPGMRVC